MLMGDLLTVESDLVTLTANAKDGKGRKLRKDKLVLLGVVVSYPVSVADLASRDDRDFRSWVKFNIEHFQRLYGEQLKAACIHWDESHPHIHLYVIPKDLQIRKVHPGIAASDAVPAPKKKEAMRAAMREWQDEYYRHVSMWTGLTRLGPGKRRLTRSAWKREKTQAASLKTTLEQAEVAKSRAERDAGEMINRLRETAEAQSAEILERARNDAQAIRSQAIRRAALMDEQARQMALKIEQDANVERESMLREAHLFLGKVKALAAKFSEYVGSLLDLLPERARWSAKKGWDGLARQADELAGSMNQTDFREHSQTPPIGVGYSKMGGKS